MWLHHEWYRCNNKTWAYTLEHWIWGIHVSLSIVLKSQGTCGRHVSGQKQSEDLRRGFILIGLHVQTTSHSVNIRSEDLQYNTGHLSAGIVLKKVWVSAHDKFALQIVCPSLLVRKQIDTQHSTRSTVLYKPERLVVRDSEIYRRKQWLTSWNHSRKVHCTSWI